MARILLVDDSLYQRIKLRKLLEVAGYEVFEAADGEEGMNLAFSRELDCMMLDLLMPKVGGMEVLREFQKRHMTLPVIVHTSDIQEQTRQECFAYGAVAVLNKPSRDEELLAAISQAIHSQGKETGNASIT